MTKPPRPVQEEFLTPLEREIYGGKYMLVYGQSGNEWCVYDDDGGVIARCRTMEHARLLAWNPIGHVTQLRFMLSNVLRASILLSDLGVKAYAFLVTIGDLIGEDATKFKENGEKVADLRNRFQKYLNDLEAFLRGDR